MAAMNLTRTAMWNAVAERNGALDGQFIYAVKTTKIYCRPSCPSRRPNKENVDFFPTPAAARTAGYRACERCRPDAERSNVQMLVENVQKYIEDNLDQKLTLEKLGGTFGASPFHLQRVFKANTGLTPKEYADECRLAAVKQQLSSGRPVTESLYEAGYSSSSRLYERSAERLGMTPRSYAKHGAGEIINCAYIRSALGLLLMAATSRGLCFLQFGNSEEELMSLLQNEFSAATIVQNAEPLSTWIQDFSAYLSGGRINPNIPIDMKGTTFQKAVWCYLRQIPPGETRTYSQVAKEIGHPSAVRAVATACASNRIALAIPCHRVIRQDGTMGGYRWGLERKEKLLETERAD
jgi:AraC family transcriptional regulator, regulatory protein of adaptative response / methylated-DNA-[protein]-cysteine methyltransferase